MEYELIELAREFGLTGFIVVVFYLLIAREINKLNDSIQSLRETIEKLIFLYKSLNK